MLYVPGFTEFVKYLQNTSLVDYVLWRDAGKPRSGDLCNIMKSSRLKFKYALRQCKDNDDAIRSDHCSRRIRLHSGNTPGNTTISVLLATTINGVTGEFIKIIKNQY